MKDQPDKSSVRGAQKLVMLAILSLPIVAVITILGLGVYSQWDDITPRWQDQRAPAAATPTNSTSTTNQAAANPTGN